MTTRIVIKNSAVAGKVPTASDLSTGELALNLKDHKLYSKDADGNIFSIGGGEGAQVPGGDTLPDSGNEIGDLFFDTTTETLYYWDGSDWKPIAGDEALALDDLSDVTADGATDGQILVYDAAAGEWIVGDLPEIPALDSGNIQPGNPSHGDLWVDTSVCPPVLNIYVDEAICPGEGGWQEIQGGGGTVKPIEPEPGDGNNTIDPPTTPGSGTELDPFVLTAKTVVYGGTVETDETISFSGFTEGAAVQFYDQNTGTNGNRFAQPAGVIAEDGTWSGKLTFTDAPDSTDETVFNGLLKIGSDSLYYKWDVTVNAGVALAQPEVLTPPNGAGVGGDPNAPGVDDVVFTSSEPATTTGSVISWGLAEWQIAKNSTFNDGRQEDSVPLSASGVQQGPTTFTLEEDTEYWVRTRYNSSDPTEVSEWSTANRFRTKESKPGGWNGPFNITTTSGDLTPYAMTYGNDRWMVVGRSSNTNFENIAYSLDGEQWVTRKNNVPDSRATIYAFDKFFAGGVDSTPVRYSEDGGDTWNLTSGIPTGGGNQIIEDFAFDGTTLLGIARTGTGRAVTSTDGHDWTVNTGIPTEAYYACDYGEPAGNPMWLAFASYGRYAYTTDPTGSWTQRDAPENVEFSSCVWGDDKFVIMGGSSTHGGWYSEDGLNWTACVGLDGGSWRDLDYHDGRWVAAGESEMAWSDDGINWTKSTPVDSNKYELVAFGQDKVVSFATKPAASMWSYTGADAVYRTLYYDETADRAVSAEMLKSRYGVDLETTDLRHLGIYPLTNQPDYPVEGYVKQGDAYKPLRDYAAEIEALRARVLELEEGGA